MRLLAGGSRNHHRSLPAGSCGWGATILPKNLLNTRELRFFFAERVSPRETVVSNCSDLTQLKEPLELGENQQIGGERLDWTIYIAETENGH